MSDETKTKTDEELPATGGSYRREKDGSLTQVEGPGVKPKTGTTQPASVPSTPSQPTHE